MIQKFVMNLLTFYKIPIRIFQEPYMKVNQTRQLLIDLTVLILKNIFKTGICYKPNNPSFNSNWDHVQKSNNEEICKEMDFIDQGVNFINILLVFVQKSSVKLLYNHHLAL
jgi:hypothetical protein